MSDRPEISALEIADPAPTWHALGFAVDGNTVELGGVLVELGAPGEGITSWSIHGIAPTESVDGLKTSSAEMGPIPTGASHPNGATGLDHVVVTTPDFERTARALERAGMPLRRIRDAGGFRQGFRRLGPAILELVENKAGPADELSRFWGLVVIVNDLGGLADRLGAHLGQPKAAVQPGRQIATLQASATSSTRVAFMTPPVTPR